MVNAGNTNRTGLAISYCLSQINRDFEKISPLLGQRRFAVDTEREIIANKLSTLLSRAEIKDLVDLYFLREAGHDIVAAIPDAQTKDGGWDSAMVSMLLESVLFDEMPVLLLKDLSLGELKKFTSQLRLAIAEHALS